MEQIHYIYKITFLKGSLEGHYYIGKRTSTIRKKKMGWSKFSDPIEWAKNDTMFDNYVGSGKIPRDYFKKYNKELGVTFNKEIICFSNTFEENRLNEEKIIGDKYKNDPLCTNITKGGLCENPRNGKLSYTYGRVVSEDMKKRLSDLAKERCKNKKMPWSGRKRTEEEKEQISLKLKEYYKTHKCSNIGRKMSDESKEKLSQSLKEFYIKHPEKRPIGRKNSEESKIKNGIAHKKLWEDNEYREKVIKSFKEYWTTHKSPTLGSHLSEERKKKLSEHFKGRPNPKNGGENNGMYGKTPVNARKIIQLTKEDVFIKEWNSLNEASRVLNLHSSNIFKVCNGERKTCGGFHWKYK